MFINAFCAVQWTNYILDGIVALFIILMLIVCAKKGFVSCFFGTVSTLVALVLAFSFAKTVLNATDGLFGLQGWFYKTFENSFSKLSGFNADISESGVEAALQEQNVSAILASLVLKDAGKLETIPQGTTLAMLLGEATSSLAATLVTGVVLFILVKLVVRLLKGILNSVAEKIPLVKGVNTLLGAVVGVLQALLIVCVILAVLTVFPITALSEYLESSLFVGKLYAHNPLVALLGTLL